MRGIRSSRRLPRRSAGLSSPRRPKVWLLLFGAAVSLLLILVGSVGYLLWEGIGIWGNNIPSGWGFDIVNFVFWVGIGHAGTLISAILFLFRQRWRTSINRFAEAMTIFAVICALLFPSIHVGRAWLLQWVMPIPESDGNMAEFPQSAALGCIRGRNLLRLFADVLVRRIDSRSGDSARSREESHSQNSLRHSSRSAGMAATGNGSITNWRI